MNALDSNTNPWKDIAAYTVADAASFKGRDFDIIRFAELIERNVCSTLYAESGIGKTSFLHAGIVPRYIKKNYLVKTIVFNDSFWSMMHQTSMECQKLESEPTKSREVLKLQVLKHKAELWMIEQLLGFPDLKLSYRYQKEVDEEWVLPFRKQSLWWLLHAYTFRSGSDKQSKEQMWLLLFDQFEEVFVKTSDELIHQALFQIFDELASTLPPAEVIYKLEELEKQHQYLEIDTTPNYRIVFSMRKEYLADFDYWTNQFYSIPELLYSRMLLLPFTVEQALEVVTEQQQGGRRVVTFDDIAEQVVMRLQSHNQRQKSGDGSTNVVEPFMLSVICSRLYAYANKQQKAMLHQDDLEAIDISNLLFDFYLERTGRLKISARHLRKIEHELVDEQGARNRVKPDTGALRKINFKQRYQQSLENEHLIRGVDGYVELIHDRIVEVIARKRKTEEEHKRKLGWRSLLVGVIGLFIAFTIGNELFTFNSSDPRPMLKKYIHLDEYWNWKRDLEDNKEIYKDLVVRMVVDSVGDDRYVSINGYPNLEHLIVRSRKQIRLGIGNCPQLKTLTLSDSIRGLRLSDCPQLHHLRLPSKLQDFWRTSGLELTSIDVGDNPCFAWENGLLWELDRRIERGRIINDAIVYALPQTDTIVPFPAVYQEVDVAEYGGQRYHNALKGVDNYRLVQRDGILEKIWFKHWVDTLDLSQELLIDSIADDAVRQSNYFRVLLLPPHLRGIGRNAFAACDSLREVRFPYSLRTIGYCAFAACHQLQEITLPSRLQQLGDRAFADCTGLQQVGLHGVSKSFYFHNSPFYGADNIREFITPADSSCYRVENNVVYYRDVPVVGHLPLPLERTDTIARRGSVAYYYQKGRIWEEGDDYKGILCNSQTSLRTSLTSYRGGYYLKGYASLICNRTGQALECLYLVPYRNNFAIDYYFEKTPCGLREIHSPFVFPNNKILLDDSLKAQITLYVPSGCSQYYLEKKAYQGFKEIREDGCMERLWTLVHFYAISPLNFFVLYPLWGTAIIIGVCIAIIVVFGLIRRNLMRRTDQSLEFNRRKINRYAFFTTLCLPVCWFIFYWTALLTLNLGCIGANIIAIPLTFFFTWELIYSKHANVLQDIQLVFKRLSHFYRDLRKREFRQQLYHHWKVSLLHRIKRWHLLTALGLFLLIGGSYELYQIRKTYRQTIASATVCRDKGDNERLHAARTLTTLRPSFLFLLPDAEVHLLDSLCTDYIDQFDNGKPITYRDVKTFDVSEDEQTLVTVSANGDERMLCVWSSKDVSVKHQMYCGSSNRSITSVRLNSSGDKLLALSDDAVLQWDIATETLLTQLTQKDAKFKTAVYTQRGARVVSVADSLYLWDVDRKQHRGILRIADKDKVRGVTISPDASLLFVAFEDQPAILCEVESGHCSALSDALDITKAVFSPEGGMLVTLGKSGTVQIRNLYTGKIEKEVDDVQAYSERFGSFNRSGDKLVLQRSNKGVKIVDLMSYNVYFHYIPEYTNEPVLGRNSDVIYLQIGRKLAKYSLSKQKVLQSYESGGHGSYTLQSVDVSKDARWLVTTSGDKKARFFDLQKGVYIDETEQADSITDRFAVFSKVPKPQLTCDDGKMVYIALDSVNRKPLRRITQSQPNSMALSPDGKWLFTCSGLDVFQWYLPHTLKEKLLFLRKIVEKEEP
ncbi:leucine-rich repeat protein [Bacteroides sp.]|uniref:leucine-rich repeat protein n=1 Tax=Bacteroides sp. TaxID=29523 RepID=UPI00262174EB|nr:leucine-rich repeat protein [Bacteroides sp.]